MHQIRNYQMFMYLKQDQTNGKNTVNGPLPKLCKRPLYMQPGNKLAFDRRWRQKQMFDEYMSDPAKPVPYTAEIAISAAAIL
jgi:predicted acyl esterase